MSRPRIALVAAVLSLVGLAAAIAALRIREDSIVFATARSHAGLVSQLPPDAQRLTVQSDGLALNALRFQASPDNDSGFWILHLHGNGESAFSPRQVRHCEALRGLGFSVLALDYRGYGDSPGSASESGLYGDAEAAYQMLLKSGVPDSRIILWGHSLGSAPAVRLATRHEAAALVLFSAITSMPEAVALRYSMQPLWRAIGVQFDSLSIIAEVHIPVVIASSRGDAVIPYAHALKLFGAANQPKRLLSLDAAPGSELGGHSDALYENLSVLKNALASMLPAMEKS
jgi:pimeloyl-ACP methyl ester carboxylesterase